MFYDRNPESMRTVPRVCAAGRDSAPRHPVHPVHPVACSKLSSLDKDLDVSTSGKFAWFVVLR